MSPRLLFRELPRWDSGVTFLPHLSAAAPWRGSTVPPSYMFEMMLHIKSHIGL